MSKAELLEEFSKLSPAERSELWDALWTLEERQLLGTGTPTEDEKAVLDRELEDHQREPHAGAPWTEVEARLRSRP